MPESSPSPPLESPTPSPSPTEPARSGVPCKPSLSGVLKRHVASSEPGYVTWKAAYHRDVGALLAELRRRGSGLRQEDP